MADAGEIKAKVVIEYDGSGLEKAKEDLASLGDVGGTAESGIGGTNEALAQFEEQAGKSAGSAKTFSEALNDLPKVTEGGTAAVSDLTGAMAEQQAVVADTASAFEEARKPVQAYNEGLQGLSDTVSSPHFTENMSAFQDALQNPYPWDMLQSYLDETGQSWTDFGNSLTGDNAAILQGSLSSGKGLQQVFTEMTASNQAWASQFGKSSDNVATGFNSVTNATSNLKDQFEQLGQPSILNTLQDLYGGVGFGPEEGLVSAGVALSSIKEPLSAIDSSLGGALSSTFENMGSMFGGMGMGIMMGAQMAIMAAGQLGQGIYDMAAIAEGPAAHSLGTFTGAVDALGQTSQAVAGQFSENFGRQVIPTVDAMNYQLSQSGGIAGDLGGTLGGISSTLLNIAGGAVAPLLLANPFTAGAGIGLIQASYEGLINQGASLIGAPLPFQGPGPVPQAQASYEQQFAQMPQNVRAQTYQTYTQSAQYLQMASDPGYLASQDQLAAAQQIYEHAQASYDASNPVNRADLLQKYQYAQYVQRQQALQQAADAQPGALVSGDWGQVGQNWNDIMGGIGNWLGGAGNWLTNLFGGGGAPTSQVAGCFPAGTRIHMADDTDKAIEDVRVGEKVIGHDGLDEVIVNVTALITPPPRKVYTLTFAHGATLTVTDSHPIATPLEGWKALSVEHAKQENPDLPISELRVGDRVLLSYGVYPLVSITPGDIVPIFNITVDGSHTFYADNVLVHNKVASAVGQQIGDQVQGIQLPKLDLSGIASQIGSDFSNLGSIGGGFHVDLSGITSQISGALAGIGSVGGLHIDLSGIANIGNTISSALAGLGSISLPSIPDLGGRISGMLSGMFASIGLPAIPDLGGMINGAMSGMFASIGIPKIPDIGGMLSGAMDGIFSGIQLPTIPQLGAMLTGAMSGMFAGIQLPQIPNLGAALSGALSSMLGSVGTSIPMFASGVEGYSGLAVVGESGPELVSLNGGSVYPMTQSTGGSAPISLGGGGGSAPQSFNIVVNLESQAILSAIGLPLAQTVRVQSGMRGY